MNHSIKWQFIAAIDLSKACLDAYLLDLSTTQARQQQLENSFDGFDQLDQWISTYSPEPARVLFVSEHTGRYGEHLLRWTTNKGRDHAVVKTTALKKVASEHPRKDDPYDAKQLADYAARFNDRLRLLQAPIPAVGQLKRLQAERRKMVSRRAALKSKLTEATIHDANMDQLIAMWTRQTELLSEHIGHLENTMDELINQNKTLKERHQTMRTAPGIGPVLGRYWLSLFAGQQKLDPRKVSSLFGFAPHPYRSGSSVKKPNRSSGYGNSEMRRLMHQAARSVANHKPHYRRYYQKKCAEGKHQLVAINNIINKLIRLYCTLWNNQTDYDPNYIQNNKDKWKKSA